MRINKLDYNILPANNTEKNIHKNEKSKQSVTPFGENISFGVKSNVDKIYERMLVELNNMFYGHRPFGFHSPEGYRAILGKFHIKDLLSLQGESAVFTMKNPEHILKLSCAPYPNYLPEFHAPEVIRGSIIAPKKYPIINAMKPLETNKFYWVIQKKGVLPVSKYDQDQLVKKVIAAGYEVEDLKFDQFAYFDGEAKFIDLGCILEKCKSEKSWKELMLIG